MLSVAQSDHFDLLNTCFAKDHGTRIESRTSREDIVDKNILSAVDYNGIGVHGKGIFHVPVTFLSVQSRLGFGKFDSIQKVFDAAIRSLLREKLSDPLTLIVASLPLFRGVKGNWDKSRPAQEISVVRVPLYHLLDIFEDVESLVIFKFMDDPATRPFC